MHETPSHGKTMRFKLPGLLFLAALLGACEPVIANRGNILDADKLAEIKAGTSTREEVATKLGTPTQISTFDDKVWYYVGRQTQQYSFLDPEVVKQKAVEIRFDDQGVVTTVTDLNLAEAHDIEPVDRATPTYGRDDTFIKQLIGNLAHPTPMQNKQEGQ
jgi:outer membrane protein assembly factor BamE (lipoprotein component of BamABCDE complex)